MEEPDVNRQLLKEDLFELFRLQLKKDFEGAGANGDFADHLPAVFDLIRKEIELQIEIASKYTASFISSLLYRVDISEAQLKINREKQTDLSFETLVAELIIKRILQKVILKKTFK